MKHSCYHFTSNLKMLKKILKKANWVLFMWKRETTQKKNAYLAGGGGRWGGSTIKGIARMNMPNQIMSIFFFSQTIKPKMFFSLNISKTLLPWDSSQIFFSIFNKWRNIVDTVCVLIVNHFCWTHSEHIEEWHRADRETSEVHISQAVIAGTCQVFKLNLVSISMCA